MTDDNIQNGDHIQGTLPTSIPQTIERVITPIQPPVQSGAQSRQNLTDGLNPTPNSGNPSFATLKATTFQVAFGHPLNYVRVLMQVRYIRNEFIIFFLFINSLDGL